MSRVAWAVITIFTVSVSGVSEAAEIRVPSDYTTIQAALDAAVDGDEVIIADGTYQGEGNRDLSLSNKAIIVRSENGPTNCIVDCQGSEAENHRGFEFSNTALGPDTILDGVTITNGYKSGDGGNGSGGAIFCAGGSPTIRNCIFSENHAEVGGGVYVWQSESRVENCLIQNNTAGYLGGGVYINGLEDEPNIVGCTITDNLAERDGGGIMCENGNASIVQCRILRNQVTDRRGGGVSIDESDAWIMDCVIQENVAPWAGGIIFTGGSSVMQNCIIRGNVQNGIYYNFTDLNLFNCLIEGNYDNEYYPVVVRGSTSTIRNCTFVGNRGLDGALIIHDECDVSLSNSIVWGIDSENSFTIKQSTAGISFCTIEGGQASITLEYSAILDWGDGNLEVEPNFVAPGYWNDNETPDDEIDDTWVVGCYHLMPGSDCIDVGDNSEVEAGETALGGQDRILNSVVDMGAYENNSDDLVVDKVTVKAGKTREAQKDSFAISGILNAQEADFLTAETITLRCGTWVEALDASAFKKSGKKPKYSYKGPAGGVTKMVLDFDKDMFSAAGKNLVLTGTTTPIILVFLIGDTYYAYAAADDENIINGKKDLPMQLLAGHTDAMRVDKVVCKQGKENNVGNLVVKGQLAAAGEVDLTAMDLTLCWGASEYPVLEGDEGFRLAGKMKYQHKKSPDAEDPATIVISIDFVKCAFQVVAKNTNWPWEEDPLNFGLQFGDFDEQEEVEF